MSKAWQPAKDDAGLQAVSRGLQKDESECRRVPQCLESSSRVAVARPLDSALTQFCHNPMQVPERR